MMQKISTPKAPAAIGPYSQGIIAGDMLFASGQIPINPATGEIEAVTIEDQARQAIINAGEILKEAGVDYSKVVKTTCFLADMNDFAAFNKVYVLAKVLLVWYLQRNWDTVSWTVIWSFRMKPVRCCMKLLQNREPMVS